MNVPRMIGSARLLPHLTTLCVVTAAAAQRPIVPITSAPPSGIQQIDWWSTASAGDAVYVAWGDVRNGVRGAWFNRSLDRGATWLPAEVPLPGTRPALSCGILELRLAAVDDEVFFVHSEGVGTPCTYNLYFNRSTDQGSTWLPVSTPVTTLPLDNYLGSEHFSAVPGLLVVAWREQLPTQRTMLARSTDGGQTWISSPRTWSWGPRFVADRAGGIHAAWNDQPPSTDLWFNRSLDGGATWLAADVRLSPSGRSPQLVADSGRVFVSWNDTRQASPEVRFDRSLDGGLTWLPAQPRLDAGGVGFYETSLAVDGNAVCAVFDVGRSRWANRSLDGGATWSVPTPVWTVYDSWGSIGGLHSVPGLLWTDHTSMYAPRQYVWFNYVSTDGGATWTFGMPPLPTGPGRSIARLYGTCGTSVYAIVFDALPQFGGDLTFQLLHGELVAGTGTPGSGGFVPRVESQLAPIAGRPTPFRVTGALGGALGLLGIGIDPPSRIAQPFAGGTLLVSPAAAWLLQFSGGAGMPGAGEAPFSIPLPAPLLGLNLNFQSFVLDPAGPAGASISRRLEAWF